MIMYEAQLLRESGQLQKVINYLDQFEAHICDILAMQEFKGLCVCMLMCMCTCECKPVCAHVCTCVNVLRMCV